jgi:transglutaminase-like putative cysteine protease
MKIRFGYQLKFQCPQPTPMILMLHAHPSRIHDLIRPDNMRLEPHIPMRIYHDTFGNTCTRIEAPAGRITMSTDAVIMDSGVPDPIFPLALEHSVSALPEETLVYLLGSRYCQTEELMEEARRLFGHVKPGWGRVQAICDFTHEQLKSGRDSVHQAITLCRCLNIPARYCMGYLGNIGVPTSNAPMDFTGWFEAYLGGAWHTFDPKNNQRRTGRIVIACGRDDADVAISTTFGQNTLESIRVWTEEVEHAPPSRSSGQIVGPQYGHA